MTIVLSALLTLIPVWNVRLEPIKVPAHIQVELGLISSAEDTYLVLDFEQTRSLLQFRDDCLALTDTLTELDALHLKYRDALELKDIEIEAKQKEIDLLAQKVDLLESAVKGHEDHNSWGPYAAVLGTVLAGTLTYIVVSR